MKQNKIKKFVEIFKNNFEKKIYNKIKRKPIKLLGVMVVAIFYSLPKENFVKISMTIQKKIKLRKKII